MTSWIQCYKFLRRFRLRNSCFTEASIKETKAFNENVLCMCSYIYIYLAD